jgi:hypothetical protein
MESCQRDRDEPTSDGQRVNHWLIEKLSPYARNPRTYSDAQIAQIGGSTAGLESKPESGLYQGRHHRRAAGACSPRESSSSKTFPPLVENLGTDRRICSIGHRYRDSHDVSFPKKRARGNLTLPKDLVLWLLFFGWPVLSAQIAVWRHRTQRAPPARRHEGNRQTPFSAREPIRALP